MKHNNLIVKEATQIKNAMTKLSKSAKKCLVVLDDEKKLIGTLTDGDIRRAFLKGKKFNDTIKGIFKKKPIKVYNNKRSQKVIKDLLIKKKIDFVPIVNSSNKFINFVTWNMVNRKKKINKRLKNVDVIIMAGGKGTRLKPFTNILPKPLIPVGKKTVIENIIDKFYHYGQNNFFISINFKSKIIKSYFEEIGFKYKISFIKEKFPMGTIGCLKLIKKKIKKNLIVSNCDTLMNFDYTSLIDFHSKNSFDVTIVAAKKKIILPYGICKLSDKINLETIEEKPTSKYIVNTGMYVLKKSVINFFPKKNKIDIDELISILLKNKKKIGVFQINDNNWQDVGIWSKYKETIEKIV